MPIVIKEVIVKTTVERQAPQWPQLPERLAEEVKREVLAELEEEIRLQERRKNRKNR